MLWERLSLSPGIQPRSDEQGIYRGGTWKPTPCSFTHAIRVAKPLVLRTSFPRGPSFEHLPVVALLLPGTNSSWKFRNVATFLFCVLWERLFPFPVLQPRPDQQGKYREVYERIQGRYMETHLVLLHSCPPGGKVAGAASAVATKFLF